MSSYRRDNRKSSEPIDINDLWKEDRPKRTNTDTDINDEWKSGENKERRSKFSDFDLERMMKDSLIDLSKNYPDPIYTLSMSDVGFLPLGEIHGIKAKSKNGKSYLCSIFIASILGCKSFPFVSKAENPVVVYFDTEQNKRNTARLVKRVHKMLGWGIEKSHTGFYALSLRQFSKEERYDLIVYLLKKWKPKAAFIDGIADLIQNFNDNEESDDAIEDLGRLAQEIDCSICMILHTNKAKDDHNMKGHLGSFLTQKASDVYEVVKKGNTFNVTQTECKNAPIADFSFSLDSEGVPVMGNVVEGKPDSKNESIRKILIRVFADKESLSYKELVESYAAHGACSEPTAKRRIKDAMDNGLLIFNDNKGYSMSS